MGLSQFGPKTPTGGRIFISLPEAFKAMDHSTLCHRGSQHRSQKVNLNQFNDRRSAIATQIPKLFD
jgi:hypothetical protein